MNKYYNKLWDVDDTLEPLERYIDIIMKEDGYVPPDVNDSMEDAMKIVINYIEELRDFRKRRDFHPFRDEYIKKKY